MKKISFTLMLLTFFVFYSCNNDESVQSETQGKPEMLTTEGIAFSHDELSLIADLSEGTTALSEEKILERANDVLNMFSTNDKTKSSKTKTIVNIKPIDLGKSDIKLKSLNQDELSTPLAYVCEFGENEGYSIISGDTRIKESCLTFVERGNYSEMNDNPASIVFMQNIKDYINFTIQKEQYKRDSLIVEIEKKILAENPEILEQGKLKFLGSIIGNIIQTELHYFYSNWEMVGFASPLVPVEWGQRAPFNDYAPRYNCDSNCPAGCVATAVAQIMSFWKYPTSIDGYAFNWSNINRYSGSYWRWFGTGYNNNWVGVPTSAPQETQLQMARLCERIGLGVGMKYDCSGSSASYEKAVDYLRRVGYKNGYYTDYRFDMVENSLSKGVPILARGSDGTNGHAWVIDGFYHMKRLVTKVLIMKNKNTGQILGQTTEKSEEHTELIHNNWGWNGSDNGYYTSGIFNTNPGPREPSNWLKMAEAGNFQFKTEMNFMLTPNYYK